MLLITQIITTCALVATAAAIVTVEARRARRRDGLRQVVGFRALLHTDDGTIRGVVAEVHEDCYAVLHAEFLQGGSPALLGGDRLLVPRAKVTMVQRLLPAEDGS